MKAITTSTNPFTWNPSLGILYLLHQLHRMYPILLIVLCCLLTVNTLHSQTVSCDNTPTNPYAALKIAASDRAASDFFGFSVAISGDYAIVGAYQEASLAGSAYIFERNSSGQWTQVQKLVASDRAVSDYFGYSVSISGDYAIVGAVYEDEDASGGNTLSDAGSAYLFERNSSGQWTQVKKLVASDRGASDLFGNSVSISGDYAIVGAVYEDEDASGGNTLSDAGSAYLFERNSSGEWIEVQKLVASDRSAYDSFGWSVSIAGDYAIVGAYNEDEDASSGSTLADAGSAYLFERNSSGQWIQVRKLVASDRGANDLFGYSVSISGDYAIVGAYFEDEDASGGNFLDRAGSAYLFERNSSGQWIQVQKLVASDRGAFDEFGISVSISGDYAIVGARGEDEDASGGNTLSFAGSAYLFERNSSGQWIEVQKLVASDRAAYDQFGWSVSISGDYAIVGAPHEDQDASGGNTLTDAGSSNVFKISCTLVLEDISVSDESCANLADGSISITASGVTTIMYSIDGINFQSSNTFSGLAAGDYLVKVQDATDATCSAVCSATVAAGISIALAAVGTDPTSCGGNGSIALTLTNVPEGIYNIYYEGGSFFEVSVSNSGLATIPAPAGIYNNLTITANGCTSVEDVDVTLSDPPIPTLSAIGTNPTTCGGNGSIALTLTNVPEGIYDIYYEGGSFFEVSVSNSGLATILAPAGIYNDLRIILANGCMSIEDVDVTLSDPLITIYPLPDMTLCQSYQLPTILGINLRGNEAYYTEPNGGGTKYDIGAIVTTSSLLYIYDVNGTCSDEKSFMVTILTIDPIGMSIAIADICSGEDAIVSISGATSLSDGTYTFTYVLNGGAPQTAVATITSGAGSFSVSGASMTNNTLALTQLENANTCSNTITGVSDNFVVNDALLDINNTTLTEGNSGSSVASFTVTLSTSCSGTVTVNYATVNGTATAGSDYQQKQGTLTFLSGEVSKTVAINVFGDNNFEADETFFVNLSAASGAIVQDGQGQSTIQNDDIEPTPCVQGTLVVTNNPATGYIDAGTYRAEIIVSDGTVQAGTTVNFYASQRIDLITDVVDDNATDPNTNIGFTVEPNGQFHAARVPCIEFLPFAGSELTNRSEEEFLDGILPAQELWLKADPNPASDYTRVSFQLARDEPINVRLLNQVGQLIAFPFRQQNYTKGEHSFILYTQDLPAGMYFIQLETKQERIATKIVVTSNR